MKIDAVLARYPWPWRARQHPIMGFWSVVCAAGKVVLDENEMKRAVCDAILELVEAHVAEMERVAKRSLSGVPKEQVLKGLGALADALNAGKAQGEASEEVKK